MASFSDAEEFRLSDDDLMTPDLGKNRERLNKIRDSLLALHKTLMESERISYEQTFGKIESQNRFLKLLIEDPWFAWLHAISQLVVVMDETLDEPQSPTDEEFRTLVKRTNNLLKASEEGEGFERSYFEALQRAPEVILAHADVMKTLPH
jgi:hypothetical protein